MSAVPVILIAEDDDTDFFFFELALRKAGCPHPVIRFHDGEEAMSYLQPGLRHDVAALFLDIKLPKLTGFQILEWMRKSARFDALKIGILSGSGEPEEVAMAARLEADFYLVKYASPAEVSRVIRAPHSENRIATLRRQVHGQLPRGFSQ